MNDELKSDLDKSVSNSGKIPKIMMINVAVFLGSIALLFINGVEIPVGVTASGSVAICCFWLFIQQKIIANSYKKLLDYKFDRLEKTVKKSEDEFLRKLSDETTEIIDDPDFDITQLSKKKDEDLV